MYTVSLGINIYPENTLSTRKQWKVRPLAGSLSSKIIVNKEYTFLEPGWGFYLGNKITF